MKGRSIIALALCFLFLTGAYAVEVETISVSSSQDSGSNLAPIAENLQLTTYREVSVGGSFQAVDPEGDLLTFRLCSEPAKGKVEVDGGSFVYTPYGGKRGRDSFTYAAYDARGNVSAPATVSIRIEKQSSQISYADMEGDACSYAAHRLAETGVFAGSQLGGTYCFQPDAQVTRGEFLTMCAALTGMQPLEGVTKTGFFDDADIGQWLKPYVSAALMCGVVQGSAGEDGRILFSPGEAISLAESAVMLNNFLELSDMTMTDQAGDVPFWAAQAVANLNACDICSYADFQAKHTLTRRQAAEMLCNAMDVMAQRGKNIRLTWAD